MYIIYYNKFKSLYIVITNHYNYVNNWKLPFSLLDDISGIENRIRINEKASFK